MALPAVDDFNRTNVGPPPSSSWTTQRNGHKVVTNQCVGNTGAASNESFWNADAFGNGQFSQVTVATSVDGGPTVRASATGASTNYYQWEGKPGASASRIAKVVAGATTNIQSGIAAVADGSVLKIIAVGTTIQVFKGGVQQGTDQTDASLATGSAGLADFAGTTVFDTWSGDNYGLEQEGYRWREDDGSEAAATWVAAQDTNITRAADVNTRLRVLVNAAAVDPASRQYQLDWRKVGGVDWRKVTTGTLTGSVDIFTVDDGQQIGTTVTLTGTSIGGDLDATTDWVALRFTNVQIPKGVTITSAVVSVVPLSSTQDEPLVTVFCEAADNSAALTTGASDISNRSRTTGVAWSNANLGADGTAYFNTPSIVADVQAVIDRAGWVLGNAFTVIIQGGSTSNRDLTIKAADVGAGQAKLVVSFDYPPAAFALAASANITASGENTTAKLTAPAGKATSDFVAGRMQDDENPTDTVDITTDDYTEFEWCLTAVSAVVVAAEVYEFRVTTVLPLDTYTVTPTFTIATAAAGAIVSVIMRQYRQRRGV